MLGHCLKRTYLDLADADAYPVAMVLPCTAEELSTFK